MRTSFRCLRIRNIRWLHCIIVLEALLVLLHSATGVTPNLIRLDSETVNEESTSIAETSPYSQQKSPEQHGTASRADSEDMLATSDPSVKGSKSDKSVTTFDTQAVRVDNYQSRTHKTLESLSHKPAPSELGFHNRRLSALEKDMERTRRLTEGNVKVKRQAYANVRKVRKKRVKRTKKHGLHTEDHKQLEPKGEHFKDIIRRSTEKLTVKSGESIEQDVVLKAMQKTQGRARRMIRSPKKQNKADDTRGGSDESDNGDKANSDEEKLEEEIGEEEKEEEAEKEEEDKEEKAEEKEGKAEKEEEEEEKEEGAEEEEEAELEEEAEEADADSEGEMSKAGKKKGSSKAESKSTSKTKSTAEAAEKPQKESKEKSKDKTKSSIKITKPNRFHRNVKYKSRQKTKRARRRWNDRRELGESRRRRKGDMRTKKRRKHLTDETPTSEPNDLDDKKYFRRKQTRLRHDQTRGVNAGLDYYDYMYSRRNRRESEVGEQGSDDHSLAKSREFHPAQNHVSDSRARFGMKPKVRGVHKKRRGVQITKRTRPNRIVHSPDSNKTAANVVADKHAHSSADGKKRMPSVLLQRPYTPPPPSAQVLLSLCSDKVCANGGTCLRSVIRGIICICATGFSGKTCDSRLDPCTSHPCQNGATCSFPAPNSLHMRCQCPAGFTGKLCQIDVNECSSEPCLNGASCVDRVDGFSCRCLSGFQGQRCETNTDDCVGRICSNGGRCIDGLNRYRCQCRPGFFGRHCQRVSDACLRSPCFNGGECIAMDSRGHFYKCLCRTGYLGARCEIQAARCVHTWCQNGGTCMEAAGSFQCLCPPGLTGNLCERELSSAHKCHPDACQRSGTCVDTSTGFRCKCPSEAVGDRCQFDRNACQPNRCVNGGLCIPTGGPFYFCLCDQRFAGKRCQLETTPCSGNGSCENGGTCLDYHLQRRPIHYLRRPCFGGDCSRITERERREWTVVRCVCPLLYTGPRCTVRNLPCTIGVCRDEQECREDPHNPVEGYSCLDKQSDDLALGNGTNSNKTVQEASPGSHERRRVSRMAAILVGAAVIVTIFGIAFLASGYTYFRSKEDDVSLPERTDKQQHIISDIRTQMGNPRT